MAADVDTRALVPSSDAGDAIAIGGSPTEPRLAPSERLAVPTALAGANGTNRATAFAFIRAPHDLVTIHAYLHWYRDRPATLRAYTR